MKKSFKLTIPAPKIRKPVAKKPNSVHKSKKSYDRKKKHKEIVWQLDVADNS
jgi:hypothetical protein